MIAKLTGRLDSTRDGQAVVDVGGVGYLVFCPTRTLARLQPGETVVLLIETQVREDGINLYGFIDAAERIAGALQDQRRRLQCLQMHRPQLLGLPRRMERIARQARPRTPAASAIMLAIRPPRDLPPITSWAGSSRSITLCQASSSTFGRSGGRRVPSLRRAAM